MDSAPKPQPSPSVVVEPAPRDLKSNDVKLAFSKCVELDKRYGKNAAAKLKGEKLTVFLKADGKVDSLRFDSPIEPKVITCVFESLSSGRFVGTTKPLTIQF